MALSDSPTESVSGSVVVPGSVVAYRDLEAGQDGSITISTTRRLGPLAEAFLGHRPQDTVTVQLPSSARFPAGGIRHYRITHVHTPTK